MNIPRSHLNHLLCIAKENESQKPLLTGLVDGGSRLLTLDAGCHRDLQPTLKESRQPKPRLDLTGALNSPLSFSSVHPRTFYSTTPSSTNQPPWSDTATRSYREQRTTYTAHTNPIDEPRHHTLHAHYNSSSSAGQPRPRQPPPPSCPTIV